MLRLLLCATMRCWGQNLRLCTCQTDILHTELHPQEFNEFRFIVQNYVQMVSTARLSSPGLGALHLIYMMRSGGILTCVTY